MDDLESINYELIYVDDGSRDRTPKLLRDLQGTQAQQVRALLLSRNFGHQIAVTAGLEHASGDAVVVIDADLQDPPELILEMVERWQDGYDVVYGVRMTVKERPFLSSGRPRIFTACSTLSNVQIPLDVGDFRLMSRRVVDALLAMPERDRFLRGMVTGSVSNRLPSCTSAPRDSQGRASIRFSR